MMDSLVDINFRTKRGRDVSTPFFVSINHLRRVVFRPRCKIRQNIQQLHSVFAIILVGLFITSDCITQATTKHKVGVVNINIYA